MYVSQCDFRDEFYTRCGKRGVIVRMLGNENAHDLRHSHAIVQVDTVEYGTYENLERRFEAEVRRYLETGVV
jgi:hypothetical protein